MDDALTQPGKAEVGHGHLNQGALPTLDDAFLEQRGRSRVNLLLDIKNQELIYDGQQLSGAMFKQPYKEQKWCESSE